MICKNRDVMTMAMTMTMKGDKDVDGKSELKKVSKVFIFYCIQEYQYLCESHVTRDKYLDGYPEIKKLSFKSGFPSRQTKSSRFGNCSNQKLTFQYFEDCWFFLPK